MAGSNPTLSDVQEAFTAAVLHIKKANGFSYDLPDDHVYKITQQKQLLSKNPLDYPKIIVTLDSGQNEKGASRRFQRSVRYGLTIILREVFVDDPNSPPVGWSSVSDELRRLVQDVEKAFLDNSTLGDTVDDVLPAEFETDSDTAYPEAILLYYFDITWRTQ